MTIDIIVFFVGSIILILAYLQLMRAFYPHKSTSNALVFGLYGALFALLIMQYLFWPGEIYPLYSLITVPMLFVISICYKAPITKMLFVAFYFLFLHTSLRGLANSFLPSISLFHVHIDTLLHIVTALLFYIVAIGLKRLTHIKNNNTYFRGFWILSLIIINTTLVYALDHRSGSYLIFYFLHLSYGHIFTFTMLGISLAIPWLYNSMAAGFEERLQLALHAQEKEYYLNQCHLMQASVENIKTMRHDIKFHLATAMDIAAKGKAEAATEYLHNLLGNIAQTEVYSNTGNIAFDSIINYKLNDTPQENIQVDIRLLIPPVLNIEIPHIVTILGNLLENAMDAMAEVTHKEIKLDIEYSKGTLFIQIENSFNGMVNYTKGNITTTKNGHSHGYGLKNVYKAVENYNGYVEINHEKGVFSVGVLMYVS